MVLKVPIYSEGNDSIQQPFHAGSRDRRVLSHLFLMHSYTKPVGWRTSFDRLWRRHCIREGLFVAKRGTGVTLGDRIRLYIILIVKLTLTFYHLFKMQAE